jgi:HprK-related kinase A
MLTVSSLTRADLGERLATRGIHLQTGGFVTHLTSSIGTVADGIALLYADYPLLDGAEFADFHVALVRRRGLRRWYRPQVDFIYDGMSMFRPLALSQAFPMFEWGLNWCVSSRVHAHVILHAAVVEKNGLAAILPAPPGSGKSTLTACLVANGWRLLSDELALIRPEDGLVQPLPRPISLKNASIDVMRRYQPGGIISPPVSDTVKGTVAHLKVPRESVERAGEPAFPAFIVFPQYSAGAALSLEEMPRAEGFMEVAKNGFNYSVTGAAGFGALATVIERARCFRFRYSVIDEAIAAFDALEPRAGSAP